MLNIVTWGLIRLKKLEITYWIYWLRKRSFAHWEDFNKQTFRIGIEMNSNGEANLDMASVILINVPDVVAVAFFHLRFKFLQYRRS